MAFSQPFNHDNDILKAFDPHLPDEIIKSSFYKNSVTSFLGRNSPADRILVDTALHPTGKPAFILRAVSGTQLLEEIMADFPCPNQCVPPMDIDGYKNSFSIGDIINAMSHSGCFLLVVHFASLKVNELLEKSSSIYGVTGSFINPIPRYNAGDNIYISTTNVRVP